MDQLLNSAELQLIKRFYLRFTTLIINDFMPSLQVQILLVLVNTNDYLEINHMTVLMLYNIAMVIMLHMVHLILT